MKSLYVQIAALLLVTTVVAIGAPAQAQTAPRIFASDLQSGPNTGGQSNKGVWVTIQGSGFGASQGSSVVTIGGSPAAAYALWSDNKIAFQLGGSAVTGNIIVSVSGVNSNPTPFTVRAGKIYFVSPQGNDSRQGTYSRPWRTLAKAAASMRPGDITYAMDGTSATTLGLTRAGTSGKPFAIVAYPNATVTVGSTSQSYAVTATKGGTNSWVLSGLTLRAAVAAVDIATATDWRLVGNDISCPSGSGTAACVLVNASSNLKLLANKVHDSGSTTSTAVANYASVQLSASSVEVGWNEIANTRACRALAFSSANGNLSGLTVHDNYIHDAVCDGISFGDVDASAGAVIAYNNIIQHVGTGPAPGGVERSYVCVQASGSGAGTVQLFNNTLHDCGAYGNADSGAIAASTPVSLVNDIVSVTAGEQYLTPNTSSSMLAGSNDLFWGDNYVPAPFTNSLNADPQFVDAANSNFALQSTSPAIDAGTNTGVATDYAGTIRPQGKSIDIGAYEFAGTVSTATGLLTENPSAVNFGTVTTGTSNTQSVAVTNAGSGSATISQMSVTGAGFSASGLSLPMTLSPGQSTSVTVTYAPQTSGTSVGSVALVSNASDATSTVQLTGSATSPAGTLTVPGTLSFGSVNVGTSSTQNVTVTASTASVTISQANVTGAGFSISGLTLPATIAAGQSASFQVKFAPTVAGTTAGSVSLVSDASNSPNTISLSGSGVSAAGTLSASPASVSFGSVAVGSSATQNVTVTASTASVTISQANVTGAGFSVSGITLPATIAAGQSAAFQVKFAPTTGGTAAGGVSLVSNASNSPTSISLSGSGVSPAGNLSASPSSISFGSVTVGSSAAQNVTVTASTASVTISQANVTGAGFSVSGLTLPATIAAGQSATFQVKFAPTMVGSVTGSLSLVSNAANTPTAVGLSGAGVTATTGSCPCSIWAATAVPAEIDSGDAQGVEVGVKFKSDVNGYITAIRYYKSSTNTGTHIGNLWSTSGTLLATATFTNETASGWQQVNFAAPVAVTAGTVYVASYYAPTGHYSDNQNYFASSGADNPPLHALATTTSADGVYAYGSSSSFPNQTWNASNYWVDVVFATSVSSSPTVGMLAASPTSLSFGSVNVGTSASKTVTVTASNASVTISQANVTGTGFSVSGLTLPMTIAAGQSATFTVTYAPTTASSVTGSLSLVSNASNSPATISLSGSGISAAGSLGASPSSISFGSVTVGSSATQTVTVTASNASVAISQANVTGTGFSVSGPTLPTTLAAGQSATFKVAYAPTTAGAVTGSLSLVSNASNSPLTVALSGTGATPTTTHSATLTWTASTSTNVVGYNVYRATQSGGPYSQVSSNSVTGTTFTDSSVAAGATYYYVVTAVDTTGAESSYSSEIAATIPTP